MTTTATTGPTPALLKAINAAFNSREFNIASILPKNANLLEKVTQATREILG